MSKQKQRSKGKTLMDITISQVVLGVLAGYLAVNIFMKFLENSGTTLLGSFAGIWAEMLMMVIALFIILLAWGVVSFKER